MARGRLPHAALLHATEAQLHGIIAVLLGGLDLDYRTGSDFQNGDTDGLPVVVKDLRHADFSADQPGHLATRL